ncbi:MAG: cupredoxin domain-containing protein [Chloroflexi bacterium]|nr:cupredoxin domain-containing protein [Chloroflexota bacterium]
MSKHHAPATTHVASSDHTIRTPLGADRRLRTVAFGVVVVVVLGVGLVLAAGTFFGQRGTPTTAGAIAMRISMAGFDPNTLEAKPGETLTIDWWNDDGAMHLENGVHTLVSDTLGIRYELPADSRKSITITAPSAPGDYDFWCDSCCGGKDSPTMHGTLHVSA